MARLLKRPEVARPAIIDLARWQAWECLPPWPVPQRQAAVKSRVKRAIVGYLLRLPAAEAAAPLAVWRRAAPELVAEVERGLSPTQPR